MLKLSFKTGLSVKGIRVKKLSNKLSLKRPHASQKQKSVSHISRDNLEKNI